MPIVFVIVLSFALQASTLEVLSGLKPYRLIYTNEKLHLIGNNLDVHITKKECSSHILRTFHHDLSKRLESFQEQTSPGDRRMMIKLNEKSLNLSSESDEAIWLSKIPTEVRRMKMEELLICRKKKK